MCIYIYIYIYILWNGSSGVAIGGGTHRGANLHQKPKIAPPFVHTPHHHLYEWGFRAEQGAHFSFRYSTPSR